MNTQNFEKTSIFTPENEDEEPKNPFEGDLFEREKFADQLTSFIERMPNGGVFAIDASWGEGKSWFARHWQAKLKNKEFITVKLDAFANDYVEDPFIMISGGLLATIKDQRKSIYKNLFKSSKNIIKGLMPTIGKLGVNIAGHLLLNNAELTDDKLEYYKYRPSIDY